MTPCIVQTLPVAGLLKGVARTQVSSNPLSRFPWVRRDLSLIVPKGVGYAEN